MYCCARWILACDPDAGLEMFAEMQPPLAPSTVLPVLAAHAPQYCNTYLEAALASGVAAHARYDSELALLYLQRIVVSRASSEAAQEGEGGVLEHDCPEYNKLRDLVSDVWFTGVI